MMFDSNEAAGSFSAARSTRIYRPLRLWNPKSLSVVAEHDTLAELQSPWQSQLVGSSKRCFHWSCYRDVSLFSTTTSSAVVSVLLVAAVSAFASNDCIEQLLLLLWPVFQTKRLPPRSSSCSQVYRTVGYLILSIPSGQRVLHSFRTFFKRRTPLVTEVLNASC